jgi:acetyl esterase/lipase
MTDTFDADLAQEPERLELEVFATPGGGRLWPYLVLALPQGQRPLFLDLTVPPGPGPHPLVVYVHGGAWLLGTPKYGNPTLRGVAMMPRLLAAGHAVARISYRLSGEARWPAQLHDCKAAIRYLRGKAGVFGLDPGRFAVLGESAGGHLAAMVALTGDDPAFGDGAGASDAVKAAVNWYGVTDLAAMHAATPPDAPSPRPEVLLVGDGPDLAQRLAAASPLAHVHPGAPPFLHQHGDHDRVVPLDQARALHQALRSAGVASDLDVIPGADHCFWGAVSPAIMDRVLDFLRAHL